MYYLKVMIGVLLLMGCIHASAQDRSWSFSTYSPIAGKDYIVVKNAESNRYHHTVIVFIDMSHPISSQMVDYFTLWSKEIPAPWKISFSPYIVGAESLYQAQVLLSVQRADLNSGVKKLFSALERTETSYKDSNKIIELLKREGLDQKFIKASTSNEMRFLMENLSIFCKRFSIKAEPSILVDGKFLVSIGDSNNLNEKIKVITYLLNTKAL